MTTPFLPPLDSMWELTQDWRAPASFFRYQNTEFTTCMGVEIGVSDWPEYGPGYKWDDAARDRWQLWRQQQLDSNENVVIPAGSTFSMERYHVSRSGEDEITLMMYRSPRRDLTPRKRGGTGKGKMRFYVSLAEFNTFGLLKEFSE